MTLRKAYEIRQWCHPNPLRGSFNFSVFLLLGIVCSGSKGTETRGRRALGPSLKLLNEHLLCLVLIYAKDNQLLPLCMEACIPVQVRSRFNENIRSSNTRREERIPMHRGCSVRIHFFEM